MSPLDLLPGYLQWSDRLETLAEYPGSLFIYGETGCGITTLATWLAQTRATPLLDDADHLTPQALETWLAQHPRGILASHQDPLGPAVAGAASRCLAFHIPSLEDAPASLASCLEAFALEEGLTPPFPTALALLPCPGNLRGLRNRLVRYKLLGQLPEAALGSQSLPLEVEDLAANLHVLERQLLHRALRRSYGNRMEAAQRLGISRRQLYLLIARHGDPVRGQIPTSEGPKRLQKRRFQNSSVPPLHR